MRRGTRRVASIRNLVPFTREKETSPGPLTMTSVTWAEDPSGLNHLWMLQEGLRWTTGLLLDASDYLR